MDSIITTKRSIHVGSNVSSKPARNPSPPYLATEAYRSPENCMHQLT